MSEESDKPSCKVNILNCFKTLSGILALTISLASTVGGFYTWASLDAFTKCSRPGVDCYNSGSVLEMHLSSSHTSPCQIPCAILKGMFTVFVATFTLSLLCNVTWGILKLLQRHNKIAPQKELSKLAFLASFNCFVISGLLVFTLAFLLWSTAECMCPSIRTRLSELRLSERFKKHRSLHEANANSMQVVEKLFERT